MQSKLGRNYLNLCFTKIKNPLSSAKTTPPHPPDHDRRPFTTAAAATTFIKNYNSLYEYSLTSAGAASSSEDDDPDATAVDFATAFTSHRFFFSSPGLSNSIIESTPSLTSSSTSSATSDSGELLFTYSMASPDPYADFRLSMQEMVEAREQMEVKKPAWEFLHELLLCYLALNPKSTHKYILGAFADLAGLIKPPLPPPDAAEDGGGERESEAVV